MPIDGSCKWHFQANQELIAASSLSVRNTVITLESLSKEDKRPTIPLGHGDPTAFPGFQTTVAAEDAIVDAVRSAKYSSYCKSLQGLLPARRAVAEYLSRDLPYKLSPDHVFLTAGCKQAIEYITAVLARPNANILLPRPGFPDYNAHAALCHIEIRIFDLLPEKGWEVDLEAVEAVADDNTVAMVIINPGNPCGNVYTRLHLMKVAEAARKLGIIVIADEVYAHLNFGENPFVPMGAFASIAPVVTLGSISKRWLVPGWRIGWLVTNDPNDILRKTGVMSSMRTLYIYSSEPATFIQGALPDILIKTKVEFFAKIIRILRDTAGICYAKIKEIPCFTCPYKPQGAMFMTVKLNLALLEGIHDDTEFCVKLAREESVVVLPGMAVGLKNWLRITYAVEPSALEEGLERIRVFCQRHSKK
ncbi:tyrosine aminotransferase-like isoform X3 [Prosopis cineraria]|uniref:tyrosine aminotransferase-like isoform X3 n=1 Tax=Prosopis cineraria TaxID=364024 RepID=UPI00240F0BD2|nr:tyrosine aminotransferase-like isoform X3 [Prosopis cineraria]